MRGPTWRAPRGGWARRPGGASVRRRGAAALAAVSVALVAAAPAGAVPGVATRPSLFISAPAVGASAPLLTGAPVAVEAPVTFTDAPQLAILALAYQPSVAMSVADRFWPVAVSAALHEDAGATRTCLVVGGRCIRRPPSLRDLEAGGSADDYLSYPAGLTSIDGQRIDFEQGIGIARQLIDNWVKAPQALDPFASAQVYFYDGGVRQWAGMLQGMPRTSEAFLNLEYWFFYPYNYLPTLVDRDDMLDHPYNSSLFTTDYHEGDWEHVDVLLAYPSLVPRYLYMARHSGEGAAVAWGASTLAMDGGHPIVYPALGGHPTYDTCGGHRRAKTYNALEDWVDCNLPMFLFSWTTTPLVDLKAAKWSCWPGHFGKAPASLRQLPPPLNLVYAAGPPSPLRQGENSDVCLGPGRPELPALPPFAL